MKKNSLFKVLGIVILLYCVLSFIIPAATSFGVLTDLTRNQIGIFKLFGAFLEAFGGFSSLLAFILLVGAFYAILNATGVYKRYILAIANKLKGKEKMFLIIVMVCIAVISSICGLEMGLFFLFPLLISILLVLGYKKMVAIVATFGATIVGMYGATFAGVLYNVNNQVLSISTTDGIWIKIILFVLGLAVLIWYTLFNAKLTKDSKKKDKVIREKAKDKKNSKEVIANELGEDVMLQDITSKKENDKKALWPITLIIALIMIVFILGSTDFAAIFGSNPFASINENLTAWTVGDFALWDKIFGGFAAFGTWFSPYRFEYYSLTLVAAMIVLAFVYRVGVSGTFDAFVEGVKKYSKAAVIVLLACSVFVLCFYYPVFTTVGSWIMSWTNSFNVVTASIFSLLGGLCYVDIYYYTYYVLSYLSEVAGSSALYPLVSILFVSMYSLAMLIAPTSVMLISTLTVTDTSYSKWIKYIWKLFAILLVIAIIVLLIYFSVLS